MKKYFSIMVFVVSVAALLAGCGGGGGGGSAPSASSSLLASGGKGSAGVGGDGGTFYIQSSGTVTVRASGSVDATFSSVTVSEPTPSFGPGFHLIVSGGITTVLVDDSVKDKPCMNSTDGDGTLYVAAATGTICSAGTDSVVTGVTVNAGATLVLADANVTDYSGYGTLIVSHDVVVNGTIIGDPILTTGLEIDSKTLFIGSTGKLSASATVLDANAREVSIGYNGNTDAVYNYGTIEAKGLGSGSGGYIDLWSNNKVVHYKTGLIDTSGGDSTTGNGGNGAYVLGNNTVEIYVSYGNFYSSGTVRMNGGRGGNGVGGDAGWALVETASVDNTRDLNGDIFISGTWEAKGGEGVSGAGGGYGYLLFQTDAMGKIAVNATMTVSGGKSTGAAGGGAGGVEFSSLNLRSVDVTLPGNIQVSGTFDVRGGDGSLEGGEGGSFAVIADGANTAFTGCDVALLGFSEFSLNGGDGANGGSGHIDPTYGPDSFEIYTFAPQYPEIDNILTTNATVSAGAIMNEANVLAKGGKAIDAAGYGGTGGYAEMIANVDFGTPLIGGPTTVIKNSGSFDLSGGTGDTGGGTARALITGDSLYFEAYRVTSSGKLVATGGNGTTAGGNGGVIEIYSTDASSIASKADMTVSYGTGATHGLLGTKIIDGI